MKTMTKIRKSIKAVQQFIKTTIKIYKFMKKKLKNIWLPMFAGLCLTAVVTSCNVTRVITNESKYIQQGDTTTVIQTKVTETYDASKKL